MEIIVGGVLLAIGGGILSRESLKLIEVKSPVALHAELVTAFPVEAEVAPELGELLDRLT